MAHSSRVLGVCLLHATGTAAGVFESIKDKVDTLQMQIFVRKESMVVNVNVLQHFANKTARSFITKMYFDTVSIIKQRYVCGTWVLARAS